jgi:hypothetical protein
MGHLCRYGILGAIAALVYTVAFAQEGENLLKNGAFDRDAAGWSLWYSPGQSDGEARWVARDGGGALGIAVRRRDTASAVQIYQGPFTVRRGAWYAISFEMRGDESGSARVSLMRSSPPYGALGLDARMTFGTEWETVSLLTRGSADSDDARIDFFPEKTCFLDNVVVRELGQQPEPCPIAVIRPGPGWIGDGSELADGNLQSFLRTPAYPDLPLLVTLDLGEGRPVGAVVVHGREYGKHESVPAVEVELSADGEDWHTWARAAKSQEADAAGSRATTFVATNVAAPARWIRLRINALQSNARLSECQVLAAPGGSGAALARLARVAPERDVAFMGWDYDRLGYALSPGESVGLRFSNRGDRPVATRLAWRLQSYAGDDMVQGQEQVRLEALQAADVPLNLPAALSDGPHRLRFRLGDADEAAFYFDSRPATGSSELTLRLAAVMDCLDPEGWARLIAGPTREEVSVRKSLPEDPSAVDAALVMAEAWTADATQVVALRRYLGLGGRAILFGKLSPGLQDLAPVTVDPADPFIPTPQRLNAPTFWPDFDSARGPRHYAVRVSAKPGSTVLAQWTDGTPAVVEGASGAGRVLYIGAPPGRLWQRTPGMEGTDELTLRALYYLLGRSEAPRLFADRAAQIASRKGDGVSLDGNFGRFGWRIGDGSLVENLGDDGTLRNPAGGAPWRVEVPGRTPVRARVVSVNWLSKKVAWEDADGVVMTSTLSIAAPCIRWEADTARLRITGDATQAAVATREGVRVLARGQEMAGDALAAGWVVLFRSDAQQRDVPRLVFVSRRPSKVRLTDALELDFADSRATQLYAGSLYGQRRLAIGATAPWAAGLPEDVIRRAERLTRLFVGFREQCTEAAELAADSVLITGRYEGGSSAGEWGVQPETVAPIPPVLALVLQHGYPARVEGELVDLDFATKYGPLMGVRGDVVQYRLPLPARDYYGVIPVEGRMELTDEIDFHGTTGISGVTRSSGGLTTGDPFLADLRAYMNAGAVPAWEAPQIDLYKWWYCFPTVAGRPAYGPQARATIDAHHRDHYWRTLNWYTPKALIRYRREPFTGLDYAVSFIWPVSFRDGVRYFTDENESASVILYCMEMYARYYGDWTTVDANWNLVDYVHRYLTREHDWALMAASNMESYSTVGIDMLNSEYPGNLAYARMAKQVGDRRAEGMGMYLAAKALVPAVARLYMPDYTASITEDGDPWREAKYYWSFREDGQTGEKGVVESGQTDFILALACGMLDTSKGTGPEIALAYKCLARDRIDAYERSLLDVEREENQPAGWAHLMNRTFLGWPREELIAAARRFGDAHRSFGWQSTKGPHNLAVICGAGTPLFLADWAPAEYVAGRYSPQERVVRLSFDNHEETGGTIRLYSQWAPESVQVNGAPAQGWAYDGQTGWLTVPLTVGRSEVQITLKREPVAPLHPYFAP